MSSSTTTTTATTHDPTGICIDPPSNKWKIGPQLGSGACGSVHILQYKSSSSTGTGKRTYINSNYAIKVAPLPPPNTKKSKKKKKNDVEKNADLLYFENTLYRNVLNELRGTMIPDIPLAGYSDGNGTGAGATCNAVPPMGFGDLDSHGIRFLIMERMESPFHSIVPLLINDWVQRKTSSSRKKSSSSSSSYIEIGSIAMRLIQLIQAIHQTQRVFVDVKPENFMIASSSSSTKPKSNKKSSSTSIQEEQTQRIRLIDFGLLEPIKDATNNKHRINSYPNGQFVGTPIYASLNVLNGHTVSRRDDLESVGYVIVELILQLMDGRKCIQTKKGRNNCLDMNQVKMDLLPWNTPSVSSDEEIYTLKKNAMNETNGDIWKLLSNDNNNNNNNRSCCREVMKEYFDIVMKLEYKEKPNYDLLCEIVSKLKIEMIDADKEYNDAFATTPSSSSMKHAKKKRSTMKSTTMTTSRRVTRSSRAEEEEEEHEEEYDNEEDDDDDVVMVSNKPTSTHKRKTRTSQKASMNPSLLTPSSNQATTTTRSSSGTSGKKSRKKRITKTTVTTTETIEIIESDDDDDDNDEDGDNFVEAKQEFHCDSIDHDDEDEEMLSAQEEDEGEEENVENHDPSADASFKSCHSMDWEMVTNDENEALVMNDNNNINRNTTTNATSSRTMTSQDDDTTQDTKLPAKELSLKLECIEGNHQGDIFTLTGEALIGLNPMKGSRNKKKQIDTFHIVNDDNDETSDVHAKLVLNKTGSKKKTLLTVRVTDMKSNHGTFVNGKKVGSSGKQAFVNDKIRIGKNVFCIKHG